MIWLILLMIGTVLAETMEDSYNQGKALANSLPSQVKNIIKSSAASEVPGYQSSLPKEAGLINKGNLSDVATSELAVNEGGQSIIKSAETRENFVIDVKTDPLFKIDTASSFNINELKPQQPGFIKKTCEEGGEDVTYECLENRHVVPRVSTKTATLTVNHLSFTPKMETYEVQTRDGGFFHHGSWETRQRQIGWTIALAKDIKAFKQQFCPNFVARDITTGASFNIDCARIKSYKINSPYSEANGMNIVTMLFPKKKVFFIDFYTPISPEFNITLTYDAYEGEAIDEWIGCASFERMVDAGLCQYAARHLTQGPQTRNINGYQIFKDAWQYKNIYHCKMIKDDCSLLRAKGCYQVSSRCKEFKGNKCWIYEKEFDCPNGKKTLGAFSLDAPFCLTGNCHNAAYEANNEILDAVARLSVFKEIQNDLRANRHDVRIFKGNSYQCRRDCLSFKDCCGGMRGWGVSLKLTNCKPEERQLAHMRAQSLCHQVGNTYCAKKILGQCVQKRTSFCCFGTKFAKIVQQQGRGQLGINWGDNKAPNCRALTITELSKLDLTKIDFSEVFADIMRKYQDPKVPLLQERVKDRINDNLTKTLDSLNQPKATTGVVYEADSL